MVGYISNLDKTDKLVLLIGFLATVKIRIVGMFSGAELILLPMFFLQNNSCYKSNVYIRRLCGLTVLWMIGTISSNIYNHIEMVDFIKGIFSLAVLYLIIPPICKLMYDKPERLVLFFFSYGLGQLIAPYTTNNDDLADFLGQEVYIYYGVLAAVSGISYLLYLLGLQRLAILSRYGIAVAGLFFMARNPFLTGTMALFMIFFIRKDQLGDEVENQMDFRAKIYRYLFFAFVAILFADSLYESLAKNGTLGLEAQQKFYTQKMRGGSVIEGGRAETFMGIMLITENPIWGYGSYAKDKNDVFHSRYAAQHNTEYKWTGDWDRMLPGHSHIVGSWVQNGVLGGVFWLYVLYMCLKVFMSGSFMREPRMLCLLVFQSCAFLWDLCFSPFNDRVYTMFFIITLLIIYDHVESGLYENNQIQQLAV